jgi:hypothetical protein
MTRNTLVPQGTGQTNLLEVAACHRYTPQRGTCRRGNSRGIRDKGSVMSVLLALSRAIDWLNAQFGVIANWLVLLACLISAGNARMRYLFSMSSNGWLEIQRSEAWCCLAPAASALPPSST